MAEKNNTFSEEAITVTFDSKAIYCNKPNNVNEFISWEKLDAVLIETTDQGPISADVFWLLLSKDMSEGCIFPQGANGEEELIAELQKKLPNFNNSMLIKAMTSVENQKFLIWKREEHNKKA